MEKLYGLIKLIMNSINVLYEILSTPQAYFKNLAKLTLVEQ